MSEFDWQRRPSRPRNDLLRLSFREVAGDEETRSALNANQSEIPRCPRDDNGTGFYIAREGRRCLRSSPTTCFRVGDELDATLGVFL